MIQSLREQAANLGGIPLQPKKQGNKTSVGFTFLDRSKADDLVAFASQQGVAMNIRSTYRAFLVTGILP